MSLTVDCLFCLRTKRIPTAAQPQKDVVDLRAKYALK